MRTWTAFNGSFGLLIRGIAKFNIKRPFEKVPKKRHQRDFPHSILLEARYIFTNDQRWIPPIQRLIQLLGQRRHLCRSILRGPSKRL